MANVISMEGIGAEYVTFYTDAGADDAGKVCEISGNDTVSVCTAGGKFCGVLRSVISGVACVQTAGVCRVGYSGSAAPTVGYCAMAGDGKGDVCADPDGREILVLHIDTAAKTADIRL